jgi:hypothetical protein
VQLPIHRVIDAAVRFPVVRDNFAGLVERVVERLEARVRLAQQRGEIRRDLAARGAANLIMLIGFGSLVAGAAGARVDPAAVLGAGLQALQPPAGPDPAES